MQGGPEALRVGEGLELLRVRACPQRNDSVARLSGCCPLVRAVGEVEQGLFNGGDEGGAEVGGSAFRVELVGVAKSELDDGLPVGQCQLRTPLRNGASDISPDARPRR